MEDEQKSKKHLELTPPRITSEQRDAIKEPIEGSLRPSPVPNKMEVYTNSKWITVNDTNNP